ncbi:MAG: hypothetical protein KGJ74_14280 [Betaproteobacteria bacterium]|jgi:hypothetical protein|nr:hypothetical protein [Betaproteobacteria bacterium]
MPIKDTFAYSARWDSVGLDCSYCMHFEGPSQWPDKQQVSKCRLHDVSLAIELREGGYKNWEWFCKQYKNNDKADKGAHPTALKELEKIRPLLQENILCRLYGDDGFLKEYPFDNLQTNAL